MGEIAGTEWHSPLVVPDDYEEDVRRAIYSSFLAGREAMAAEFRMLLRAASDDHTHDDG